MTVHYSKDFEEHEDGWWYARCECGWEGSLEFPDAETACDALMEHAAGEARFDEQNRNRAAS